MNRAREVLARCYAGSSWDMVNEDGKDAFRKGADEVLGTYGPLCGRRPNDEWTLIVAPWLLMEPDRRWFLPLCSRCLSELDKLNEAASNE